MKKFNCNEEFASEALQNVVGGNVDNFSMTWSAKASADSYFTNTCRRRQDNDDRRPRTGSVQTGQKDDDLPA